MQNASSVKPLSLSINGRSVCFEGRPVQTTLLDFLREQGLTGAKEGCAEGECGACTVALVAGQGSGCSYQAVNSCLMFAPMAADREIVTVEALASGDRLEPAQTAMAEAGGSQCGYCTPGFVMSLFAEHYRPDRQGPCDPHALGGNLCRCTGYRPIQAAVRSLGRAPEGRFRDRLSRPAASLKQVEYESDGSRFSRPASLAECFAIAAEDPKARWIAGATDLGVESNLKFRRWPHLVSLEAIPELREFSESNGLVRIGAGLSLTEAAQAWTSAPEAVDQWVPLFASLAIRNRATLGGNLATASPIGDSAPLLLALDASVVLRSVSGSRTVPLARFFTGYRQTVLQPGELIASVEIEKPYPAFTRFYKASKRRMDDISTVAAGLAMDFNTTGRVSRARFAFGGVGPTPMRVYEAEEAALGEAWNEATVRKVQAVIARTLRPLSDHRGSADYRAQVAQSLIEKFCWEWRELAA